MEELQKLLVSAGFSEIEILTKDNSDDIIRGWNFGDGVEKMVCSAYVRAGKP